MLQLAGRSRVRTVMTAIPLNYALAKRRRRIRNWLALIALIAVGLVCFRYGTNIKARVRLLISQRQVMNFDPPAGTTIGPYSHAALPEPLVGFARQTGFFRGYNDVHSFQVPMVIFAHRLRNKADERLVVVTVEDYCSSDTPMCREGLSFGADVIEPATLFKLPKVVRSQSLFDPSELPGAGSQGDVSGVRVAAGHPDPFDPSAFTIDYWCDGAHGVLRGRLTDDDQIEITDKSPDHLWTRIRAEALPGPNGV